VEEWPAFYTVQLGQLKAVKKGEGRRHEATRTEQWKNRRDVAQRLEDETIKTLKRTRNDSTQKRVTTKLVNAPRG
jgi:hypothetical protein